MSIYGVNDVIEPIRINFNIRYDYTLGFDVLKDWRSKWDQDVENFIECGAFEVPDPENSFTGPIFLVEDEHGLKNYVDDPGDAPEENPNHCLDEIHFYLI